MKTLLRNTAVAAAVLTTAALTAPEARADYPVEYEGRVSAGLGSGDFAPFYIASLDHGRYTRARSATLEVMARRQIDRSRRFSYGFGLDIAGGYGNAVGYDRYSATDGWSVHDMRPSALWIQQLYGELQYRQVFLTAGMKEQHSKMLNQRLTSGDLAESGNTRPIAEVRAGFLDFVDIPLTRGAVQVFGEVGYGKFADSDWITEQYNYYNDHIVEGEYYNYKCIYLRSTPEKPLSVTIGMQATAIYGGYERFYNKGVMVQEISYPAGLTTMLKMLVPYNDYAEGGFYTGDHRGTIDLKVRYRLTGGTELSAYLSNPWEDGSGLGKMNGWDGLWGLEYKASDPDAWVSGAVVEYLDLTNQSGPIHYDQSDFEGSTLGGHATGADDYYNNRAHRPYTNYGLGIGTPMVMSTLYNTNGYASYMTNLTRGFHVAVEGRLSPTVRYRLKGGYRKAWGNGQFLLPKPLTLTAVMAEAEWRPARIAGLALNGKIEIDRGTMPSNAFGALVTLKYDGIFNLKK